MSAAPELHCAGSEANRCKESSKERQRPLDSEEAAALRVTRPERAASCRHEQRVQRTTCARLGGALQLPKLWSCSSARVLQEDGEVEITRDSVGCVRSHARGPPLFRARPASPQRIFPSLLCSPRPPLFFLLSTRQVTALRPRRLASSHSPAPVSPSRTESPRK